MQSIALVVTSENSAPHTIENTEFITELGAFQFHEIINATESLPCALEKLKSTQLLILYTSNKCADSSVAANSLSAACQSLSTEEFSISTLTGENQLRSNEDGFHSFLGGVKMTLHKAMETLKQPPSSALRVTQCNGIPKVVELNLNEKESDETSDYIHSLHACLHAILQGSAYVPYRDSSISKLLWPALAGKVQSFTSICVIDTERTANTAPALSFSANFYKLSQFDRAHLEEVYAQNRKMNKAASKHKSRGIQPVACLRDEVRKAADELAGLYEQELAKARAEHIKKKHEFEAQVACEIHTLCRIRNETISGLKKEIHCLEFQLSIARHQQDSRTRGEVKREKETWFSQELRRKCKLKKELGHQRAELLKALAEADKFEVSEPIRGIIRQSEFNLKSLRKRVEAAELFVE